VDAIPSIVDHELSIQKGLTSPKWAFFNTYLVVMQNITTFEKKGSTTIKVGNHACITEIPPSLNLWTKSCGVSVSVTSVLIIDTGATREVEITPHFV
jgi:hypothetical protein